jgi:hypothetical protein
VEKGQAAADQRLDELYREHPEGFVAKRNELVKALRADGDRAEADRLKKLRRPTAAAWLINRVAIDSPELAEEFAAAGEAVEDAQRRALEGDDRATTEWRAAADREREATDAVRDAAERAARDAGHRASPRALELLVDTLRAAGGDPELRDRVVNGRVERERSAATLGISSLGATPRPARSAKRRGAAQAQRELKRLQDELAEATARAERLRDRVEEAAEVVRRDKATLAATKRETTTLKRRVRAVERRARDEDRAG